MPTEPPPAPDRGEISRPRFVGRQRELTELARVRAQASTAVVLVEGEAGVGKTRLVREYLAARPDVGAPAIEAVCPPFREPFSLGPVVDGLRTATGSVADLDLTPLAGALRPVFPEWAEELPPALEPLPDPTGTRHRLFRALGELIAALDVRVLVLEDAHWADETTLEFLLFLVSTQRHDDLSMLVTYRPAEVPEGSPLLLLSSRLPDRVALCRLELGGLSEDEVAGLVASMLDGDTISPEFATFLYRYSEGLPLAVEELVRLMHSRADLTRRDGSWVRRHLTDIGVPRSIRDAVLERLSRLEPSVREVLKSAAIVADPTDEATLVKVSGLSTGEVADGLAVALEAGWLQSHGQQVGFRHVLASKAVYDSIAGHRRRAMHLRAGESLEGHSPGPLVRLARHFREAGETERWCRYAELASDRAAESGDQMTATTLLHELIVHADLPASALARVASKLGDAAVRRRETVDELHTQVVATLLDVLDSAELTPQESAEIRERRGRLLLQMGDLETGYRELELALPQLDHEPVEAARAMTFLGFPLADPRPAATYLERLERAAAVADRVREPAERLALIGDRATALLVLGEDRGWEVAEELPERVSGLEQQKQLARAHGNLGYAAMVWGCYAESDRRLTAALELAAATDNQRLHANVLHSQARLHWWMGRWDRITDDGHSWTDDGDGWPAALELEERLVRGLHDVATGLWDNAERALREVVDEAKVSTTADVQMTAAGGLARAMLDRGEPVAALEVTDEPIAILRRSEIWIWATDIAEHRVDALLGAGRDREAVELVDAFALGIEGRSAPGPMAALETCRGLLADAAGEAETAAATYERAVAAWTALPRPYDAELTRERLGRSRLAMGDVSRGIEMLSEACRNLHALGARRDADRIAHVLREHGAEVSRPWRGGRRGYGDALSPRELEVARLVRDGLTNREIAGALFLSPKTVARHLNSAMRKAKVTSRTALALQLAGAGAEVESARK
ncbi:MAG TPA: AAA family ATPase [Nocardioidaceae bacterium]|nr:AAA family ATPase [Nocardioidaceae bacterium]